MFLLIDNYDSFTYNLYQLLAQMVDELKVVRNDEITLDEVEALNPQGIILSPGPGRPENAGICVDLVKRFYKTTPILGVCLGHQSIAMAFGGEVTHAPEIIHGKQTSVFHRRDTIFKDMPLPFSAGRYHSLLVDRDTLPKELVVDAENPDKLIMALRHKDYPVYGLQFHPESILTPQGDLLLKQFVREASEASA